MLRISSYFCFYL